MAINALRTEMSNKNVENIISEALLQNVPTAFDPANPNSRIRIGYEGTWAGVVGSGSGQNYSLPVLPQDMSWPMVVSVQRANTVDSLRQIQPAIDGLRPVSPSAFFMEWDWYDNCIWLNAVTTETNIYIRYRKDLREITDLEQQIPVKDSLEFLAYFAAARFSASRGGTSSNAVADLDEKAKIALQKNLMTRSAQRRERRGAHRRPIGTSGRRSSGWS